MVNSLKRVPLKVRLDPTRSAARKAQQLLLSSRIPTLQRNLEIPKENFAYNIGPLPPPKYGHRLHPSGLAQTRAVSVRNRFKNVMLATSSTACRLFRSPDLWETR